MRLTDASVAIRPRSAWEALDLGILLAHRHARLLMGSWALLTLPLFAVLSLLLWQHPTLAILIFWWLKPAFERLPLYILSHALFGDTPTLKQALRAYPALLRKQLPASLLWRRFSPTRSFDLPVLQLEGLAGESRSQRLIVLSQRNAGGATWLTVVGVHLEMALWAGFAMLLYLLIPAQNEIDWNWQSLLDPEAGEWLWLEHLSNLLYVLVLVVWEPIYVACGFTLYLNRRTELEAWDIELVFRRLRQRLVGSAYVLLLGLAASLAWLPALPPTPSRRPPPAPAKPSYRPSRPACCGRNSTANRPASRSGRSSTARRSRTARPLRAGASATRPRKRTAARRTKSGSRHSSRPWPTGCRSVTRRRSSKCCSGRCCSARCSCWSGATVNGCACSSATWACRNGPAAKRRR